MMSKEAISQRFSLGDYISVIEQRLSPRIVGKADLDRIYQLADVLPGELSTFFGFECPMDPERTDADFLFCSNQLEKQSSILADSQARILLSEIAISSAWSKVSSFCREWDRVGSVSFDKLQNIWLEFDIGQSQPPWHPSIFFGLDPVDFPDSEAISQKVLEVLPLLDAEAVVGERLSMLKTVKESLPSSAHIFQVGVMLSRSMPAVRVCIRNLAASELPGFLRKISWSGDVGRVKQQLQRFNGNFETVDVDLDVGVEVGEKIGLEFTFGNTESTLEKMTEFLNTCVQDSLVDQSKAEGLLAYNGLVHDDTNSGVWPAYLRKQTVLLGGDMLNFIACWIHHIKIDFKSDNSLMAKAYLAVQPGKASRADLLHSVKGIHRVNAG